MYQCVIGQNAALQVGAIADEGEEGQFLATSQGAAFPALFPGPLALHLQAVFYMDAFGELFHRKPALDNLLPALRRISINRPRDPDLGAVAK